VEHHTKNALKLLSEAEKLSRTSSERSTWFTVTLLQLGSQPSSDHTQSSSSSRRQSCKTTEDDPSSDSRDISSFKHKSDLQYMSQKSTPTASHLKAVNDSSSLQMDMP
jgi:putative salt-induced outer membrane protein YdiY